jgi:ABC-2 type transport system ATP-binding protein
MIQVKNLTKHYKTYSRGHSLKDTFSSLFKREFATIEAVKGITFDISKGELVSFIGPNGAGKSTTLKVLTGILFPSSGEVDILGYIPWKHRKKYVANIGAVFGQKSQLIWDIPPQDAFYMNKEIYSINDRDFKQRLHEMVEMLEVGHIVEKPTRLLSLGERMKCEFIMAMLHDPKIVFLDEPTIGLDVVAKEKIRDFIRNKNQQGITFILTTHDLDDIERLAKRVIVINHGEIIFDNTMGLLRRHLGDKKLIHISTAKALPEKEFDGVSIIDEISDTEKKIELDLSVLSLDGFLRSINTDNSLIDLSIEELPIERIITSLYSMKEK